MREVRRGVGDTLGGGGGGGGFVGWGRGMLGRWGRGSVDVRKWSKVLFFSIFGKLLHIGRPWMKMFLRVLQKVAKIRVNT